MNSDADSRGGSFVGGRFRLGRPLGCGASGIVYEAFDGDRKQRVALKTLNNLAPSSLYRFKREFRLFADVAHPNIVVLYELLSHAGTWFFTMELIDGVDFLSHVGGGGAPMHSLADPTSGDGSSTIYLMSDPAAENDEAPNDTSSLTTSGSDAAGAMWRATATLPMGEGLPEWPQQPVRGELVNLDLLRKSLVQLADGLTAIHHTGHVHRDIKPSNVIVAGDGRVVVLDFGVITQHVGASSSGKLIEIMGTPAYIAPELLDRSARVLPAADWYSFGVMLYEALVGRRPFVGDPSQVLKAKRTRPIVPPRFLRENVPSDLDAICVELLNTEPMLRPTGDAVLKRLRAGSQGLGEVPRRASGETMALGKKKALIGRDEHLAVLHRALGATEGGDGIAVFVPGHSGVGKTALVQHFLDQLEGYDDVVTLEGRCYEAESVPYKALDSLVDSLCHYLMRVPSCMLETMLPPETPALARVFPVLGRVPTIMEMSQAAPATAMEASLLRRSAFDALLELLRGIGSTKRLVVFIDDMQWGDMDSVPLLASLIGLGAPRLLLLATYRSEDADTSAALNALFAMIKDERSFASGLSFLSVEPLSDEQSRQLAHLLLRDGGSSAAQPLLADRIAEEAKGSPYFLHELVRFRRSAGDGAEEATTLDSVIRARVGMLSDSAQRLLRAIAVAGSRISHRVAQMAAGLDEGQVRAFAELRAAHFARTTGAREEGRIETYHDRVRDAVVSSLDATGKNAVHHRLAQALDETPEEGVEHVYALAHHYYLADPPDAARRVFETNLMAGQTAAGSYAYDQAYRFLAQAQEIAKRRGIERKSQFDRLFGQVCALTGHIDLAVSAFDRALIRAVWPNERAALHFGMSKAYLGQLETAASEDELHRAMTEIGLPIPANSLRGWAVSVRQLVKGLVMLNRRAEPEELDDEQREQCRMAVQMYLQASFAGYFRLLRHIPVQSMMLSLSFAVRLRDTREFGLWYAAASTIMAAGVRSNVPRKLSDRAIAVGQRLNDPLTLARAMVFRGVVEHFLSSPVRAAELSRHALDTYGKWLENVDYLTGVADLSWNLLMRGHAQEAWTWVWRGLQRAAVGRTDRRLTEGHTYRCYAGPLLSMLGRGEEGRQHLDEYRDFIRGATVEPWRWAQYYAHQALHHVMEGELGEPLEQIFAAHRTLGIRPGQLGQQLRHIYVAQAYARLRQLMAHGDRPRDRAGWRRLRRAIRNLRTGLYHVTLESHRLVVEAGAYRLRGHWRRASRRLEKAERLARVHDNTWVLYEVACERARGAAARGESDEARTVAQEALAIATDHEWVRMAEGARREFGLA